MKNYTETFTDEDISVTLVVEAADGGVPSEGDEYRVRYWVDGVDDSETELMSNFSKDDIFEKLEFLAEDYFDAEKRRREQGCQSRG